MKSSTGELLDLHIETSAEPPRSGFTGALELYDELINFLGLTPETSSQVAAPTHQTRPDEIATVAAEETTETNAAANSGALANSEDVIKVTGMLSSVAPAKAADTARLACGDCGQDSDSGEMFCIHCGGLLEEPAARAEAVTPSAAEYCDDCGAAVERDEIFCPSCGSVRASA